MGNVRPIGPGVAHVDAWIDNLPSMLLQEMEIFLVLRIDAQRHFHRSVNVQRQREKSLELYSLLIIPLPLIFEGSIAAPGSHGRELFGVDRPPHILPEFQINDWQELVPTSSTCWDWAPRGTNVEPNREELVCVCKA